MARPRKDSEEIPATERETAPETAIQQAYVPTAPRVMRVERQGAMGEPLVHHYPQVRGGICEFCGVIDKNYASQVQYKLCPHYRGMDLRCSYCPDTKDPDEVIRISKLEIVDHPEKPGTLVVVCNSYDCERAHQRRFQVANQ